MSEKIKIFMPCSDANHVCDKSQYKEASLWEKIVLNIHLIYCAACRKYSKKNNILSNKIKESKVECLDEKCKEKMRKELEKSIKENAL
ncbi:MAG: hypothetical protein ABJL44_06535 [Algibacter sp.]